VSHRYGLPMPSPTPEAAHAAAHATFGAFGRTEARIGPFRKLEGRLSKSVAWLVDQDSAVWQSREMRREEVIATLRAHEPELKAAGILHLRLHGSVARGEATAGSDVDLIADIDTSRRFSLLDMVGLENRLSDLLGVHVDLSPAHVLKEPVRAKAAREAVLAF
jgi:predicted nucleotidyltransferase